jgi:hypothetical protein
VSKVGGAWEEIAVKDGRVNADDIHDGVDISWHESEGWEGGEAVV